MGASVSWRDARGLDFSSALPGTASSGFAHFTGEDTRWGIEASLDYHRVRLRGELMRAQFHPTTGGTGPLTAAGGYAQVSYRFSGHLEAAAKLERFDPNTSVRNQWDQRQASVGLTYLLRGRKDRLQLVYARPMGLGQVGPSRMVCQFQKFL